MKEKLQIRYQAALHAMQSGVRFLLDWNPETAYSGECSPKHLRVGVNAALIDSGALATILLKKGIFTEEEYFQALAETAERDVQSYVQKLEKMTGKKVTLV